MLAEILVLMHVPRTFTATVIVAPEESVPKTAMHWLCVWSMDGWEKQNSTFLDVTYGPAQTRVQFHRNQIHFLVVHKTQMSIYEATKLDRLYHWSPVSQLSITDASYSCDC